MEEYSKPSPQRRKRFTSKRVNTALLRASDDDDEHTHTTKKVHRVLAARRGHRNVFVHVRPSRLDEEHPHANAQGLCAVTLFFLLHPRSIWMKKAHTHTSTPSSPSIRSGRRRSKTGSRRQNPLDARFQGGCKSKCKAEGKQRQAKKERCYRCTLEPMKRSGRKEADTHTHIHRQRQTDTETYTPANARSLPSSSLRQCHLSVFPEVQHGEAELVVGQRGLLVKGKAGHGGLHHLVQRSLLMRVP